MVRKANALCRDVPLYAMVESAVLDGMMVWDEDSGDYSITRPGAYGWLDDVVCGVCRLSDRMGKNELRYGLLLGLFCDMPLGQQIDTRTIENMTGLHERTARRYMVGLSIMLMVIRRIVVPDDTAAGYRICADGLASVMQRIR